MVKFIVLFGLYKWGAGFPLADSEITWLLYNKKATIRNRLLHKMADGLLEKNYGRKAVRSLKEIINNLVKKNEALILMPIANKLAKWQKMTPEHIEILIRNEPKVAAVFLRKSEIIPETKIVEWVNEFGKEVALPILDRKNISHKIISTIVRTLDQETVIKLLARQDITIHSTDIAYISEKYADVKEILNMLKLRGDVPVDILKNEIFIALDNLYVYVRKIGLMSEIKAQVIFQQGYDRAILSMLRKIKKDMMPDFIRRMHDRGYISMTLLYRSIMLDNLEFVVDVFSVLSGKKANSVKSLLLTGGKLGYEFLAQDSGFEKIDSRDLHLIVEIYKQIKEKKDQRLSPLQFCNRMIARLNYITKMSKKDFSDRLRSVIQLIEKEIQVR